MMAPGMSATLAPSRPWSAFLKPEMECTVILVEPVCTEEYLSFVSLQPVCIIETCQVKHYQVNTIIFSMKFLPVCVAFSR